MNKSSRRNRGATPGSVCTLRRQMLGDQGADALGSSCHDGGFTLKPVHVILLRCEDCLCAPTFRGKSRQGRKADTARDRGLSALPSSAPTDAVRQCRFGPLPQGAAVLASGVPCFRGPVRRRHPFPAPRKHESPRGSHAFAAALKAGRFGKQAAKAWHTSYTPWGDGGWAEPGRGRGGNRRGRRTA
jgi:hypothetical protein